MSGKYVDFVVECGDFVVEVVDCGRYIAPERGDLVVEVVDFPGDVTTCDIEGSKLRFYI